MALVFIGMILLVFCCCKIMKRKDDEDETLNESLRFEEPVDKARGKTTKKQGQQKYYGIN